MSKRYIKVNPQLGIHCTYSNPTCVGMATVIMVVEEEYTNEIAKIIEIERAYCEDHFDPSLEG